MPTGTISAIKAQLNDSQRVSLFIDDVFALGVSLTTLADERLYVGQVIDEETWARLEATEQADKALHAALRLLEFRPRSVAEIRLALRRKQYPAEAIDHAVARLLDLGLLDDARFSQTLVENRRALQSRGTLALRDELRRKGIDRTTIEATLAAEEPDGEAERERALSLARSVAHKYAGAPDRASFQRRLGGFLQRRGFRVDTIRPILAMLWAERRAEIDE